MILYFKRVHLYYIHKIILEIFIYTIILHKSVCQRSQTAGRNSCAIVSGDVSN